MACLKRNYGGGWVRPGVGGKAAIVTVPSHQDLCDTHKKPAKIGSVSGSAWRFGPEYLVKTKFVMIYHKKNMDRAFQIFKKI
jgi:hypothetical protein